MALMMWIEYLNNPLGLRVGDCVIRAISKALNATWEEVYIDLWLEKVTWKIMSSMK